MWKISVLFPAKHTPAKNNIINNAVNNDVDNRNNSINNNSVIDVNNLNSSGTSKDEVINNFANSTNPNNLNRGTTSNSSGTGKNVIPVANTGKDEAPTFRLIGSILVALGIIIVDVYKKKAHKELYK